MVHVLDLQFLGTDQTIAAFLVETGDGLALVETGPYSTFPQLKQHVSQLGFTLEDIQHVFLTHIHLDHAGAAWALAERGATVYVHPFGMRHLLDPSKLMESARRIYQDEMDRLWGDMRPIPADRLQAVEHETVIRIGDLSWKAWHTPGHAVHHIAWQLSDVLFTGDVAGVRIGNGIVVPPCPPPDINIEDWQASIRLIRSLQPRLLYLTHFGPVSNAGTHLYELENRLLAWAAWMLPYYEKRVEPQVIIPQFEAYVKEELAANGVSGEQLVRYEYANPAWMSVAGLLRYWKKKSQER